MVWTPSKIFCLLTIIFALIGCGGNEKSPAPEGTWPFHAEALAVTAPRGVVASDDSLASHTGVEIMRHGGNAVDAAVATAFALAVTMPEAGNIGGGGFLVLRLPDGTTAALDFREKAPLAAGRDMYLDKNGKMTDRSITGHLAAGVPGTVAGMFEVHHKYGRLPWADVVNPAIRLADEGFIMSKSFSLAIQRDSARLVRFPGSAALFLPGGHPVPEGTRWRNPDLAQTLRLIAARGPAGFYEGETASLIVKEMQRGDGIITARDLQEYTTVWRKPVQANYRGYQIISMPPPSSGGITIAQLANMLEGYDLPHMPWHSVAHIHLLAETMRRAFADRNYWLGDPDAVKFPQEAMISKSYAATRRATIDRYRATPSSEVFPGLTPVHEGVHTTHYSVVDSAGTMVAVTTTVNLSFGSAVIVQGAGFFLNNEMDDFAAKPGSPNVFGLVQGEANAIAPGRRILSSMSPTVVLDSAGAPVLITGASGGPRIITATFQVISNVLDFHMPVDSAVDAPRVHHQHLPDHLMMEQDGFPAETRKELQAMGHTLKIVERLGIAPSIARRGNAWRGAADPRNAAGCAAGY